jgi:spermidine synthase
MYGKNLIKKFVAVLAICFSQQSISAVQEVSMQTIYEQKSMYRNVQVVGNDEIRCMGFKAKMGIKLMGCQRLDNPDLLVSNFSKLLLGSLYLNPKPQNVLVVGLGVGTVPNVLRKVYPDLQIDNVEIDPVVVDAAKNFF